MNAKELTEELLHIAQDWDTGDEVLARLQLSDLISELVANGIEGEK